MHPSIIVVALLALAGCVVARVLRVSCSHLAWLTSASTKVMARKEKAGLQRQDDIGDEGNNTSCR